MLINTTKNALVDQYIKEGIDLVIAKHDGAIAAYVGGSYANDYSIPTSDIDLYLFFDRDINREKYEEIEALNKNLNCSIDLDLIAYGLDQVKKVGMPSLNESFLHVWGKDISDEIPTPSIENEAYRGMHGGYMRMSLTRKEKPYMFPLKYPVENQELKGYDWRDLKVNGKEVKSIKEVVVLTGWMCTGLVNWAGRRLVPTKKHAPSLFKELFPGYISDAFEEVTHYCRNTFYYLVPTRKKDYKKLVSLLPNVLIIENFFLKKYQDFLIEYLLTNDPVRSNTSIVRLGEIIYPNDRSLKALESFNPQNNRQETNLVCSINALRAHHK